LAQADLDLLACPPFHALPPFQPAMASTVVQASLEASPGSSTPKTVQPLEADILAQTREEGAAQQGPEVVLEAELEPACSEGVERETACESRGHVQSEVASPVGDVQLQVECIAKGERRHPQLGPDHKQDVSVAAHVVSETKLVVPVELCMAGSEDERMTVDFDGESNVVESLDTPLQTLVEAAAHPGLAGEQGPFEAGSCPKVAFKQEKAEELLGPQELHAHSQGSSSSELVGQRRIASKDCDVEMQSHASSEAKGQAKNPAPAVEPHAVSLEDGQPSGKAALSPTAAYRLDLPSECEEVQREAIDRVDDARGHGLDSAAPSEGIAAPELLLSHEGQDASLSSFAPQVAQTVGAHEEQGSAAAGAEEPAEAGPAEEFGGQSTAPASQPQTATAEPLARAAAEGAATEAAAESAPQPEERTALVAAFLRENGYSAVGAPKRTLLKMKYPIHTAAKQGDPELVRMLLAEGADPAQRTSWGKTAAQIAREKDRKGSHTAVLRALGGA